MKPIMPRTNIARSTLTSVFIAVFLLCSSISFANPIADFKMVGKAKLEVLFWDVYRSELYTPSGTFEAKIFPQALKIHYLRNIKSKDLIERTDEEWQKLGISATQTAPWLEQLTAIWPDIKKGDELLLLVDQQHRSRFYFNNDIIGDIEDTDFGFNFLRIWLDEKSSYPDLQRQLIGENK
ncbi:MAG: chalcone isomerase family protein [Paraglaciecola sp.]|uniref:chalcone isomerase family protein n=1 Tax=Paraglaciecola sp. TaxID=1920173 RepID=UPI00273E2A30|nr:chalcone isomerase family protein [Paraglaciecola sp.]MDP5130656.1 chalcone isomerase family protein [Paraglaciecola sp.]